MTFLFLLLLLILAPSLFFNLLKFAFSLLALTALFFALLASQPLLL